MSSPTDKPLSGGKADAFADLLARNRAREIRTGGTVDALIAQHLKDHKFFAALALACAELERLGAGYGTHARVARCEMILGLYLRAGRSWKAALQFQKTAQAHTGIGTVLFQQGDTPGAIRAFQEALAIDEENAEALESLSAAHLYLDDPVAARRYATLALRHDPDRLESRLCRARAEIALGHHKAAREDLGIVMARRYKENEVRLLEVDLLVENGEYESAIFLASQLCERYPESRDCLDTFRRAYAAFDESDRRDDLSEFLEGLDHFVPLPDAAKRGNSPSTPGEEIDVIIPVHNAWDAVRRCVVSVKAASGPALGRIILVDDGSDAKTRAKLEELAVSVGGIRLVETPRQSGFSRALALGVMESHAAAFVALNSDTIVTEGWLDKLHAALRSATTVAMVGPLSNNAGWQNYGPVMGAQGGFAGSATPSARCRADLSAEIGQRDGAVLVPMHLLHGFCVLVDRQAYDAHGGVDQTVFPEGYGEFQDLSIRLRGSGRDLLVAADCVVFHERGASLSPNRRAALSLAGRKSLYGAYSALNYLCLEMASIRTPVLTRCRKALGPVLKAWDI